MLHSKQCSRTETHIFIKIWEGSGTESISPWPEDNHFSRDACAVISGRIDGDGVQPGAKTELFNQSDF